MKLESLRVLHLPKGRDKKVLSNLRLPPPGFYLDTCQRQVWIFDTKNWYSGEVPQGFELFEGQDAYRFLLGWASGLESEVLGETDIFGQIKEAWRGISLTRDPQVLELSSWIQRLFEDTKEIRTQYLQNLGGSSYGTLIRKWIKDRSKGPILLVGAGQIAHSVAPVLLDSELWLWNRDPIKLCAFHQDLKGRSAGARLRMIETGRDEEQAWKEAAHIVVGIPVNEEFDSKHAAWFLEGGTSHRTIVHLGTRKQESGVWSSIPGFACLDDLFALQSKLGNVRSVQVTQAEKACKERAKLRALGVSLSIPHGWEDLACFA